MLSNTSGSNNTAIGKESLTANINGLENVAIGNASLGSNTGGMLNTAIGYSSMNSSTGNFKVAVGASAGGGNGNNNVALGYQALTSSSGDNNVALGYQAMITHGAGTSGAGAGNTAIGTLALYSSSNGDDNTAVGKGSGYSNTTGSGNVFIGKDAGNNSDHDTESNKLVIANSNTTTPLIEGDFSAKTLKVNGSIEATNGFIKVIGDEQILTANNQTININGDIIILNANYSGGSNMTGMTLAAGSRNGQEVKLVNTSSKYISITGNLSNPSTNIAYGWAQSFVWYGSYWYPNVQ